MRAKTAITGFILILIVAGFSSCGGYYRLSKEFDAYGGTQYYKAQLEASKTAGDEAGHEVKSRAESAEADFAAGVEALKERRALWGKALEPGADEAFYMPDADALERLAPAAADAEKAVSVVAGDFSLQSLEILALIRNPGVMAAESEFRAVLERYSQSWRLDEILRQYSAFTEGLMTGIGPMKGREPVRMNFPFPGMLALKGDIVTAEARAAREMLEKARRAAITDARRVYWNLLSSTRSENITREMLDLLKRLETVASTRYEAGETSFQDVIKVRINRETVEEDLKTVIEMQHNQKAAVRALLDLPHGSVLGRPLFLEPEEISYDLEGLYEKARLNRQELGILRARVAKMELVIKMAEKRIYPDYNLNLSLYDANEINTTGTFRMSEPFAVTTTASIGAGVPKMPWYGTNEAYVRETRQKLEGLRKQLSEAEDQTMVIVRNAWFRLDRALREKKLFGESVVNLSQAALEVSTSGYEAGNVMFADVIASYTSWLKARLTLERLRADLGIAHAEIEDGVGARIVQKAGGGGERKEGVQKID